ncbi:MAG: glycoside hydrolase family 3 C-terminal domain-containing protein, partial [Bacteroidales bacterium]|nr:glycoside hydrolase family 3 C-terminal domain-containing protein [Bacteroidales bacterium]
MKKRISEIGFFVICFFAIIFIISCKTETKIPIYLDNSYSFEERAADLVSRFTIEEKQSLLGNTMAAVPRLGVNTYYVWGEALHGVVPMFNPNEGKATSFPSSSALASSWDPDLIEREAIAISDEARAFNNPVIANLTYWSPVIEPIRDPRWGRTAETYGEDPFLISRMGSGFVRGMMGNDPVYLKTVPCGKHYFANNSEFDRHISSSNMDDRDMREYYLLPYKELIEKDNLPSIMTCYNAVNGIPMSANKYLVDTIARKTYGLYGYITGDCGAIQDIQTGHLYVSTAAEAAASGLRSGVDTDCGSVYQTSAIDAVSKGLISEAEMDLALVNMFTTRMRIGEFDPPSSVPFSKIDNRVVNSPEHVELAVEVAKKTPVLLKNGLKSNSDRKILPLNASEIKKIALIGPQVDKVELGPYSGTPLESNMVTPLAGIRKLLAEKGASTEVVYTEGANTISRSNLFSIYWFEIVTKDGAAVRYDASQPASMAEGLTVGSGLTPVKSIKSIVDGDWAMFRNINISDIESVNINMGIPGDGGYVEFRLGSRTGPLLATIDGKGSMGMYSAFLPSVLTAKANQTGLLGSQTLYLVFRAPEIPAISQETKDLAALADVAVLFVGTDDRTSNEEADRLSLDLPGNQYELIDAVAAVNPNTIVVMQTHGMVEVERFKNNPNVAGIIWTGFNGQAQGAAMAAILFGDVNPGGKLNATWFRSMKDLPPITDYELRGDRNKNGRTLWYFNKPVSYEFGYGLSYTTFEYSNFRISKSLITPNEKITVSVDVKNTGDIDGDEVVQIYLRTPESPASLQRPEKRLKGFKKVAIPAGETITVDINIDCADLWFWDPENDRITFDSGKYIFEIGSSSKDIRGQAEAHMSGSFNSVLKTVVAECGKVVIKPGNTVRTSVTAAMSDDSFYNIKDARIVFSSNNPAVATVDANGLVTAVASGVAAITAEVTIDGVSKSDSFPL